MVTFSKISGQFACLRELFLLFSLRKVSVVLKLTCEMEDCSQKKKMGCKAGGIFAEQHSALNWGNKSMKCWFFLIVRQQYKMRGS